MTQSKSILLPAVEWISPYEVGMAIAAAVHPLPAVEEWSFTLDRVVIDPEVRDIPYRAALSKNDFDVFDAFCRQMKLPELTPAMANHHPTNDAWAPYAKALESKRWTHPWKPEQKSLGSNIQLAETNRKTAARKHGEAIFELVTSGAIPAIDGDHAPCRRIDPTVKIRRQDAIAYLERCGLVLLPSSTELRSMIQAEQDAAIKKSALIEQHKRNWPSIETDINDASRNSLGSAKSTKKGYWNEAAAIAWAKARGKYTADRSSSSSLWPLATP